MIEIPNSGTLLASAARTTTTTSSTFNVDAGRNLLVYLVTTVASGTGGLTLKIEINDPISGIWVNIGQDTSARTTATNIGFAVGPASGNSGTLTNSTFVTKQFPIAGTCRVTVLASDASSYTYSVTYTIA